MAVVTDDQLIPKNVNKSGEVKDLPSPKLVTNATFTENPKKPYVEMKTNGELPTFRKAGLNKGGASRVSD